MTTPDSRRIPTSRLAVHYALVFVTSISWIAAMSHHPTQQWILHRGFGLTALMLVLYGWIKALDSGSVLAGLRSFGRALIDLQAMTISSERRRLGSSFIMPTVITYGLAVTTVVLLTGLPSIVPMDAIFAPRIWVIWCRHIHIVAACVLMLLWTVNAYSLMLTALTRTQPAQRSGFRA